MKILLLIIGVISLALGVVGIVVPLLPTTPFLLLSAAIFVKCSPVMYNWLINNKILGEYIVNYRENRAMPLRAKCTSISILWVSILYAIFLPARGVLWLQIVLFIVLVGVTYHLLSLSTTSKKRD